MLKPVRTTASWLGGRLVLLLIIIAALVASDAYRDEFSLLTAQLRGLLPDRELVGRLEAGREQLENDAAEQADRVIRELRSAPARSAASIDTRIAEIGREVTRKTHQRRSSVQRAISLVNGEGFQDDIRNEIDIQLLTAERDALLRLRKQLDWLQPSIGDAADRFVQARERTLSTWHAYRAKKKELKEYEDANALLIWVPGSTAWQRAAALRRDVNRSFDVYDAAGKDFYAARDRWRKARAARRADVTQVEAASQSALGPLNELIATKRAALESAHRQAQRFRGSVGSVFVDALWILVLVTLAPVAIKAFWYWIVAPLATRRPPIRLRAPAAASSGDPPFPASALVNEKGSALSQELTIGDHEELLVHPNFLQSSTDRGRKDTRWLLSWAYPFTSIAAGMVVLTRIRATGVDTIVVSSTTDPFSEVGVISLAEGTALVLQPRNLIGIVQAIDRPIRIRRRWLFGLSAWITFQFRYLIFEGPGKLILQGRRGIRVEQAGRGRSIDQRATIGFSPGLDYSPRRSETFGAYLLGMRGLFNDNFSGGPGFYVYEEMPYFGSRSGITGRGLEGLTDGLLKVFGI
jgi:uncharacterized protein (AIM24 family)